MWLIIIGGLVGGGNKLQITLQDDFIYFVSTCDLFF